MTATTPCHRCGDRIDPTQPHITITRHVEQQHGDVIDVRGSAEIAAFHTVCAPSVGDVLAGFTVAGMAGVAGPTGSPA